MAGEMRDGKVSQGEYFYYFSFCQERKKCTHFFLGASEKKKGWKRDSLSFYSARGKTVFLYSWLLVEKGLAEGRSTVGGGGGPASTLVSIRRKD